MHFPVLPCRGLPVIVLPPRCCNISVFVELTSKSESSKQSPQRNNILSIYANPWSPPASLKLGNHGMDGSQYIANLSRHIAAHEKALLSSPLLLTPHHLYYLLSRFEELNVPIGDVSVRLPTATTSYSSFFRQREADSISIRSVSSVRSSVSALWKVFVPKQNEKESLRYLYSCFTKIPHLQISAESKVKLISGWEEFPFDTAVPLSIFKNLKSLKLLNIPIHALYGWDDLANSLRSLELKHVGMEDINDVINAAVFDQLERRRKRRGLSRNGSRGSRSEPSPAHASREDARDYFDSPPLQQVSRESKAEGAAQGRTHASSSPHQSQSPSLNSPVISGRSRSSSEITKNPTTVPSGDAARARHNSASSTLLTRPVLPQNSTHWRLLRHLSVCDNALTSVSPLALPHLLSLDLSQNLLACVPDLSLLSSLRSLDLSNNMIETLASSTPLPALSTLLLRGNRLSSLYGLEKIPSISRLDMRDNSTSDPLELGRVSLAPNISEIWVAGNPFTGKFLSYRLTIFNLFRASPGRETDIVLDGSGPGVLERRSLVSFTPLSLSPLNTKQGNEEKVIAVGRKKVRKPHDAHGAISPEVGSPQDTTNPNTATSYRRRIEALRNEVGDGWLTVLSEEGWNDTGGGKSKSVQA